MDEAERNAEWRSLRREYFKIFGEYPGFPVLDIPCPETQIEQIRYCVENKVDLWETFYKEDLELSKMPDILI